MTTITPQPDLHQDCLDKLNRALDLVLKTAEAASAENNHKLVIQSAREVTRIAGLIHKMTSSKAKPVPSPRTGQALPKTTAPSAPGQKTSLRPKPAGQTDINPADLIMPDLETLFTPDDLACWKGLPDNIFKKFSENYREFQTIGKDMAAELLAANQESRAAD